MAELIRVGKRVRVPRQPQPLTGKDLKQARKDLGYSQQKLAEIFEQPRRSFSYWERRKKPPNPFELLAYIKVIRARILGNKIGEVNDAIRQAIPCQDSGIGLMTGNEIWIFEHRGSFSILDLTDTRTAAALFTSTYPNQAVSLGRAGIERLHKQGVSIHTLGFGSETRTTELSSFLWVPMHSESERLPINTVFATAYNKIGANGEIIRSDNGPFNEQDVMKTGEELERHMSQFPQSLWKILAYYRQIKA